MMFSQPSFVNTDSWTQNSLSVPSNIRRRRSSTRPRCSPAPRRGRSSSLDVPQGLSIPFMVFTGRTFAYCWKPLRIGTSSPTAKRGPARRDSRPRRGRSLEALEDLQPVLRHHLARLVVCSQLQGYDVHAILKPNRSPAASSTACPRHHLVADAVSVDHRDLVFPHFAMYLSPFYAKPHVGYSTRYLFIVSSGS